VLGTGAVAALVVSGLTAGLVHRAGDLARRLSHGGRPRPVALVAGRELLTASRPVVRACAAVTLLSLFAIHAWALTAVSSTELRNALANYRANHDVALQLGVSGTRERAPQIAEALPAGVALLQFSGDYGAPQDVYGTCQDLEAVLGSCQAVPAGRATFPVPQAQAWIHGDTVVLHPLDRAGTAPDPLATVLVSTDGKPLDRAALRRTIASSVTPAFELSYPIEGWVVPSAASQDQARWFLTGGLLGLLVVVAATACTLTFEMLRSARRFASLGVIVESPASFRRLGWGITGLPVVVAIVAGLGVALLQSATEIVLDDRLSFPWLPVLAVVVLSTALGLAAGGATGRAIRRTARRWRSGDEE